MNPNNLQKTTHFHTGLPVGIYSGGNAERVYVSEVAVLMFGPQARIYQPEGKRYEDRVGYVSVRREGPLLPVWIL